MSDHEEQGFLLATVEGLPLQVPVEILAQQTQLGLQAVMLWINLLFFSQQHQRVTIPAAAERMGMELAEAKKALAVLADQGWINDEGYEIKLCVPPSSEEVPQPVSHDPMLDENQAAYEWLINFWTNRIASPTPEEMKKLLFWMEKKGVSHEVIAVAIEEMCTKVKQPHISYLEGVLRNWVTEGVQSYADLQAKPHLTNVLPHQQPSSAIHPQAQQKWKELFPDEFES